MESVSDLERQFQESRKEAEASFKRREGIHEPTLEQKAHAINILGTLSLLHKELLQKSEQAHKLELLPGNLTPSIIEFFGEVEILLNECATEADRLRIRIERDHETQDLVHVVQLGRREDLATMIRSLDSVTQRVADLVATYEAEVEKAAAHREREDQALTLLETVLKQYQK